MVVGIAVTSVVNDCFALAHIVVAVVLSFNFDLVGGEAMETRR